MLSAIFALGLLAPARADTVTLDSLLAEMVDRSEIARLADPAYKCYQASSYDRRTLSPDDQNDWYANMDRSWFVRKEVNDGRTEHVMMDVDGPGAVVRIWVTWDGNSVAPNSIMRFYFDGSEEPAIEGRAIDIVSGGMLAGAPLSTSVSPMTDIVRRGHNLYLPIPFAKGCKVTVEIDAEVDDGAYRSPAFYYQINYRLYEPSTQVETFSMSGLERAKSSGLVDEVNSQISQEYRAPSGIGLSQLSTSLSHGQTAVMNVHGGLVITGLKLEMKADDMEQALRSVVLAMEFDGEKTVWAPAGALFGPGHENAPFWSWWSSYDGEDLVCHWPMPFRERARIWVNNHGDQEVEFKLTAFDEPWEWDERSLYFHAVWNPSYSIDTQAGTSTSWLRAIDYNFATVRGQGKWVGDVLMIYNGAATWWGEGDEKIWVDGEDFPSHIGTGTEDYYGYAWGNPNAYSHPFIAQPDGSGNNKTEGSVNLRWRSLDAIPFDESIQFDMELWHWAKTKVNFEPASLFYARPGATVNVHPLPGMAGMRVPRKKGDVVPIYFLEGAIEAESMAVSATGGNIEQQSHPGLKWSGDLQVWWMDGEVGDELTLVFDSDREGEFEIFAGLTIANDYGIASFSLNGANLIQDFDLYSPSLGFKEFSLGRGTLKNSGNVLKVKLTGSNEKAIRRMMVGIDYIRPAS